MAKLNISQRRGNKNHGKEDPFIANMMKGFFLLFLIMILCIYITVFSQMNQVNNSNSNGNNNEIAANSLLLQENRIQSNSVSDKTSLLRAAVPGSATTNQDDSSSNIDNNNNNMMEKTNNYHDWKQIALNLSKLSNEQILIELKENDPFGVRTFEKKLLEKEDSLGRILTQDEISSLFTCPTDGNRITLPDFRDADKSQRFRDGYQSFMFFQHLRKAGGTQFCTMAKANMPQETIAKYYCMPDYRWSNWKCAGCLLKFTNEEIESKLGDFRIVGNEWDNFDPNRFFDLDATFTTSFRKPLDRALSQFRFECIEDRGCHEKNVEKWWPRRNDLKNVYTTTFANPRTLGLKKTYTQESSMEEQRRMEIMEVALDTVSKFNLVLVMEWLAYAGPLVTETLGFSDVSLLTQRIRPFVNHEGSTRKSDGQETNALGAQGIHKASWAPEEYLSAKQYKTMSQDLALDEILTDVARRMFLERMVCDDLEN